MESEHGLEAKARLGKRIRSRRAELGMSTVEFAERARLGSRKTSSRYETGTWKTVQETTKVKLEDALLWGRGSFDAVLNGGEPIELPTPAETREMDSENGDRLAIYRGLPSAGPKLLREILKVMNEAQREE